MRTSLTKPTAKLGITHTQRLIRTLSVRGHGWRVMHGLHVRARHVRTRGTRGMHPGHHRLYACQHQTMMFNLVVTYGSRVAVRICIDIAAWMRGLLLRVGISLILRRWRLLGNYGRRSHMR